MIISNVKNNLININLTNEGTQNANEQKRVTLPEIIIKNDRYLINEIIIINKTRSI